MDGHPFKADTLDRFAKRAIQNSCWQRMADGRMVNTETGEILSLIQWVERYKKCGDF